MIEFSKYVLMACQIGLWLVAMNRAFVFMKFYIAIYQLPEAECYRQWYQLADKERLKNSKINDKYAWLVKSLYLMDISKKINTNLFYVLILTVMLIML